ncbi:MAG: ABC transporter ATP-binding protein [Butyricicoccaceae bacterium]
MSEYSIEVKDLCISYRDLKAYSIKKMLLRGKKNEKDVFQAVKNVSFALEPGEVLGIIGKNGSGKSTMLKSIAGIFSADSGTIDLHGHSVSLLAIGVGFQKQLSGRENIMLSGMLLGFSEEYIQERMDDIIEFSELGKFIDKPVRTYSSGMYSKLAFSIATTLESDILLIDEVLSVGDEHFKKKSAARTKQLIQNKNRTVIIVSHNISTLKSMCTKVMWMHEGEVVKIGEPAAVLKEYKEFMK